MNVTRMGYSDPYALSALQGNSAATGAQSISPSSDGSDDPSVSGSREAHHHRGGGGGGKMGAAMMEALQSIGITLPAPPDASASNGTASTGTASTTSAADGTTSSTDASSSTDAAAGSAPIDLRKDMGDLMHTLFEAVKGEDGTASTTTASTSDGSSGRGANSFAAGLSSLISQAANGTAPADLQTAFKTLTTDLQALQSGSSTTATSGASSTSTTTASTTATASADTTATLQAFLTQLQDNLGYGATSSATATSNLINSIA